MAYQKDVCWGHVIFIHYHHDPSGSWTDWGFRFASPGEAWLGARSLLLRITSVMPHIYVAPDITQHCSIFPVMAAINTGDGLDLLQPVDETPDTADRYSLISIMAALNTRADLHLSRGRIC